MSVGMLTLITANASLALAAAAAGQTDGSRHALRFFGTGVGPPGQQDRVRIPIDDNLPGVAGHTACDVGAGDFSIDLWSRGRLQDNASAAGPGDRETFDFNWIEGNIIVDRDIYGGSSRDWGISIAGGRVRFGTGRADVAPLDSEHTIEGSVNVLNGAWRHVCVTRDRTSGVKAIYVDGVLDYASPPNRSRDDISYPDAGVIGQVTPWGPYIVIAAEKHDAGAEYPSFNGFIDELRVWSVALTAAEVQARFDRVLEPSTPGLVGMYRFEEGAGTHVASTAAGAAPTGQLIAGVVGNGQWVARADDPLNTAPVQPPTACPGDFNHSGAATVEDLFDYLASFFGNQPAADVNHSGDVTVQDLFDFLEGYFLPCP